MLTVPEAARRVHRDPETVRRWIRSGRLRSEKIGTQHLVDEHELDAAAGEPEPVEVPGGWGTLPDGSPMPDGVRLVRGSRSLH